VRKSIGAAGRTTLTFRLRRALPGRRTRLVVRLSVVDPAGNLRRAERRFTLRAR
jgi:hypothetical protein